MLLRVVARRRQEVTTLVVVIVLLQSRVKARRNELIANTDKGRVRGLRYHIPSLGTAVDAFLGIPFAKPPVGHLRFKHPEPIERWDGTWNATRLPNSCYQMPDITFGSEFYGSNMWNPTTRVSEDCLYLNVWRPRTSPRLKKSAVLLWIYGGAFYSGTTTLNLYDGRFLAAANNIIVVSIGYRLGAMGFLSLGHPSAPGNAGLFDQLMGLEWVQNNIHHFGGDPNNVTLFGESAGSVSVSLHLLSPLSRSKFQRAIMQSGTVNMPWGTVTLEEGKRRSLEMAITYLGCPSGDDMQSVVDCLKAIGPKQLVTNQWVAQGIMQFPFLPVIDGTFLPESPTEALRRGSFKKCPILLGSNENEASFFVIYEIDELGLDHNNLTREHFKMSMHSLFNYYPQYPHSINAFGMEAIKYQYSPWQDKDNRFQNARALDMAASDCHFVCHVNRFAKIYADAGENVYSYFFTERYRSNPWPKWMGVMHGDEIMFVFGDPLKPELNYTKAEKELSFKMMAYWSKFAKSGWANILLLLSYILNPFKIDFTLSSSSTTSRELLSQFSTCSGWIWFDVV